MKIDTVTSVDDRGRGWAYGMGVLNTDEKYPLVLVGRHLYLLDCIAAYSLMGWFDGRLPRQFPYLLWKDRCICSFDYRGIIVGIKHVENSADSILVNRMLEEEARDLWDHCINIAPPLVREHWRKIPFDPAKIKVYGG